MLISAIKMRLSLREQNLFFMNWKNYNRNRKKARTAGRAHYGKTAVHVVLNGQEIDRVYFSDYSDAMDFCRNVKTYYNIEGVSAFTNY